VPFGLAFALPTGAVWIAAGRTVLVSEARRVPRPWPERRTPILTAVLTAFLAMEIVK